VVKKEEQVENVNDEDLNVSDQEEPQGEGEETTGLEEDINEVDELAQLQEEAATAKDTMLRMAAEFENYKKRMERERSTMMKYAEEAIIKELLPSIDNLERAIEQGRETSNIDDLLTGVELTRKGLLAALEKFEVSPLESIGAPFDPNHHEALAMEESSDVEANSILKEFQKGYMFKDRLIRPAKVVVAKKAEEAQE
jgi:molecular chaperone GrpE